MLHEQIILELEMIPKVKTADIEKIAKQYLKDGVDVSVLKPYIEKHYAIFRIYFVVSLKRIKDYKLQTKFIEDHQHYFNDWWHIDLLLQLLVKAPSFEYVFAKAKHYLASPLLFMRRWGYVIFLSGFQKNPDYTKDILSLYKNDEEYYVHMGAAWLLADLCIYNSEEVLTFIAAKKVDYKIIGKGIQKICDSFRISEEVKNKAKALRVLYK